MTPWLGVLKTTIGSMVKHLPRYFLRRLYPERRVLDGIELDLRSFSPACVFQIGGIPTVQVALRLTSFLPFDVKVERISLGLWFGQPTTKLISLEALTLPAYSTVDNVLLDGHLNDFEFQAVKRFLSTIDSSGYFTAAGTAHCNVTFAAYTKRFSIERRGHDLSAIARYVSPLSVPKEEPA